ncbi:MAG: potassium-transporting ATPase subunit KdpC [Actinobacteria bacterium]|nr:potassium-transporting ATPase subunit KdpC [Actinomycetota bacterium]
MRRQIAASLGVLALLTVLAGLAYPLLTTAVAQTAFRARAEGSLVRRGGRVVGSSLLAQPFSSPRYFHPRPSAAGDGYDATASGASNLGPTNPKLAAQVAERARAYRAENGLAPGTAVPVDAVTTSASGLDPGISVANARLQARRVAAARGLPVARVLQLVRAHTTGRPFGILGEEAVDVLDLNLALDAMR